MQASILTQKRHGALAALLLATGLAAHGVVSLNAARRKSATFDEPLHLTAGYTHLALHDYRLCPQHPPLVKSWAALPLVLGRRPVFREDDPNWRDNLQRKLSRQFYYRWNDGERLLRRARPMMVALGAALAAAVFCWTRRHWGLRAAALALGLCVLSPDLLAHGPLVTTDVAAALLIFLTVAAFERLTGRATPPRLLVAGLCLGAAAAAKFSALSLLPMLGALGFVAALSKAPLVVGGFGRERVLQTRRQKLAAMAAMLTVMVVVGAVVVSATYGFRVSARAYFQGLLYWAGEQGREDARGGAFLLGRESDRGWWYYFPVTFALKTPLPLILLLAARLVLWRRFRGSRVEWFLWLPVATYLAIAMAFPLNIGHRHLLPIYPFLFAAAGGMARAAARSRSATVAVAALAAWYAAGTLRLHPHYLAYFNEAAGGPRNGYRLLADSNLDWGQDLPGLKAYMDRHGIKRVKLSYFGPADPAWFGIAHDPLPGFPPPARLAKEVLPGELVAVSATNLQSVRLEKGRRLMRRLRDTKPIGNIGYSILLFRPDFRWTLEQER